MASRGEFRDLTAVAAAERFRQFLSERSSALAALVSRAASAGLTLDGSVQSLPTLWEWMAPQLENGNRFERQEHDPSWLVEGHPADALTGDSVELLDGLVSYLGEVFAAQTDLGWELETRDSRSTTYQHPVFAGGVFVPVNVLNSTLRSSAASDVAGEQLMYWVGASIANTNAAGPEEQIARPLDVAVEPIDLPDFNWEIWVDETAESVLGTEAFDSLESRLSAIPQVTAVAHEDREIYLVQAEEITREDLEAAIRRAVDRADPRKSC